MNTVMKEYKIITLTPTSNSTVKSMEGYVRSCENSLNKLAKDGWRLVCTESISQQEMSNLILFMEREAQEVASEILYRRHSIPEEMAETPDVLIEHPNPVRLPKN